MEVFPYDLWHKTLLFLYSNGLLIRHVIYAFLGNNIASVVLQLTCTDKKFTHKRSWNYWQRENEISEPKSLSVWWM